MIWLLIGLAFVVALLLGVSLTILFLIALVLALVLVPIFVFGVSAMFWLLVGLVLMLTVIESENRATIWLLGLGLLASLIIILDGNRAHMEPMQADPQMGEPPPRRRPRARRIGSPGEAPPGAGTARVALGETAHPAVEPVLAEPMPPMPAEPALIMPAEPALIMPAEPALIMPVADARAAAGRSTELPRGDGGTWPFEDEAPGGRGLSAVTRAAISRLLFRRRGVRTQRLRP